MFRQVSAAAVAGAMVIVLALEMGAADLVTWLT
ncbi:hypothetical protein ABIC52_002383 [Curtobacterium oceanosedimentum]|jgi:hypothetical protein